LGAVCRCWAQGLLGATMPLAGLAGRYLGWLRLTGQGMRYGF
jgi:hypothetical protein